MLYNLIMQHKINNFMDIVDKYDQSDFGNIQIDKSMNIIDL